MSRQHGTIARIVVDRETGKRRGFGFIRTDDTGEDLFFHASSLVGPVTQFDHVNEGDAVRFRIGEGRKGLMAVSVEVRA